MLLSIWPGSLQPFEEILATARHAEASGWDGVWFADHFMADGEMDGAPFQEAWTTLSALAAIVPRVRLGTLVIGNTYRHPAVLAKMAANVDHISGGRFVLGLGASWQENEHRAYGIPFYTLPERLARLEEACQVIQGLFQNERTTFRGRFYELDDAPLSPKPIQEPLPLMIGGGGERITLRIAARYAQEWNARADLETMIRKMDILDAHCAEIGRDPRSIRRSTMALIGLADDEGSERRMRENAPFSPLLTGDPQRIHDQVKAYADAGIDELIVPDFNLGRGDAKLEALNRVLACIGPAARADPWSNERARGLDPSSDQRRGGT
jgi:F420-dependent oxidoreductase-like protein